MIKNYAIVENGIVINVIVADDNFIAQFHPDSAHPYEEVHADDTMVARIGDTYDAATGAFITPTPEVTLITSITMRQARLALLAHNKLSDVQTTIDSLPSPMKEQAQIEWEYASDVEITNPLIIQLMGSLGFTETNLDNLFIEASKL